MSMGVELVFTEDDSVVVTVVGERKVQYGDEITSLSAISDRIKGYSTSGPQFFTYNGKTISQIAEETRVKEKMRTLIVGNGIDIQFGRPSEYGNYAILERMLKNVNEDKYSGLGFDKQELLDILDTCEKTINKIIRNKVGIPKDNNYLFLQMEMERVRRTYTGNPSAYCY